ncbi:MAG: helix-turn-helix domain-containing protein [Nocardiopsaceae bacterium]|nr:helix-turn-helix domain-containing protein [Nocardiopsaceae bacterium]
MSIGETLADARSQSGLTVAQVSQRTRIRESIIRAIEQNDFSPCGGDFYARGHIRSIASVVGADPAPLIREYDSEHPPAAMSAADVFEPSTPIKIREPRRRFGVGILAIVVLLAVIGFGAYYLVNSRGPHSTASSHSTATPAATVTPGSTSAGKRSPTASPSPTATRKAGKPGKTGKPKAVIALTAKQDCWVELTTPGGPKIYQGTLSAGATKTWTEKHTISMVIGNPPGAELKVDGKAVKPNTSQVVTLTIDPSAKTPVSISAPAGATLTTNGT